MKIKSILKAISYITKMILYIMSLPFFGCWFYRRNCGINIQFCYNMCSHYIFRTVYMLIFGSGMLTFDILYVWLAKDHTSIIMAMAVSVILIWERVSHSLLSALNSNSSLLCGLMLVALAAVFTPHMLPFAVNLYFLLVAAAFYPSSRALEKFQSYYGMKYYREHPALLLDIYFS